MKDTNPKINQKRWPDPRETATVAYLNRKTGEALLRLLQQVERAQQVNAIWLSASDTVCLSELETELTKTL